MPGKLILFLKTMIQFQPITDDQSKGISSSNQDYLNQKKKKYLAKPSAKKYTISIKN